MSEKQILVVDANIISHALTPSQTEAYVKLFAELELKYRFAVTGFTKYEVLCSSDKTHRKKIEEFLDQNMGYINLNRQLMDFSSRICFLYTHHPSTKGHHITMGDIVNGAFTLAKDCHLLTIDNNDYPVPFFQEINRKRIEYTSKSGKAQIDTVHIFKADIESAKEGLERLKI